MRMLLLRVVPRKDVIIYKDSCNFEPNGSAIRGHIQLNNFERAEN